MYVIGVDPSRNWTGLVLLKCQKPKPGHAPKKLELVRHEVVRPKLDGEMIVPVAARIAIAAIKMAKGIDPNWPNTLRCIEVPYLAMGEPNRKVQVNSFQEQCYIVGCLFALGTILVNPQQVKTFFGIPRSVPADAEGTKSTWKKRQVVEAVSKLVDVPKFSNQEMTFAICDAVGAAILGIMEWTLHEEAYADDDKRIGYS